MTPPGTLHAIRPKSALALVLGLLWTAALATPAAAVSGGPNWIYLPLVYNATNSSPSSPTCLAAIPCQASSNENYEVETQNRINGERQSRGLTALAADGALVQIARFHSRDMAAHNYFTHDGLAEKWADRFAWTGEHYAGMGEIIAAGQPTPEAVVKAWMGSAGHKAIIVDPNNTVFGAGYVSGSGKYGVYWTVDFAVLKPSTALSVLDAFGPQPPDCTTRQETTAQGALSAVVCR